MADKLKAAKIIAITTLAVAALGWAGWGYYQSPQQVAGRQLKQAAQAQASGQTLKAAELFAGVAQGGSDKVSEGAAGLRGLLTTATLKPLPAADAAGVLRQALRARSAGQSPLPPKGLLDLGWALVMAHGEKDPLGAKAVLDAIAPLETEQDKLAEAAEALLERIVAANPANAAASIEYAVLLDRRGACERCAELLMPHAAAVGRGEGARILGKIYASIDKLDESYALLQPYTEDKLKIYVQREAEYRETYAAIEKEVIATLRAGKAPADFYKRHDAANEATKRELVTQHLDEQLSASPKLKASVQALREAAAIVPVALDLGVLTVYRAQKLTDPAARKAQFEAAEKVFLSIRSSASNSDNYRLHLGQVYYWLGKQAEGKKLFDEALTARERDFNLMLDVASLLRSVGAVQEARVLTEEAYGKAKNNEQRSSAAHMRSVMSTSSEDELMWLERCDRSDGRVRASIHNIRAQLAERRGQRTVAKREYELAAAEHAKLPESATQLNSTALVHLALYAMEGDPKHRDRGLAKLDQALALMPTDSTLLLNNISAVSSAAAAAIVGERIDLPLLHTSGSISMVEFLHHDEASRERVRALVRNNEAVKKGLAYSDKAALLAPRNPESYRFAATIAGALEDAAAMKALVTRTQAAQLDLTDIQSGLQKNLDGSDMKQQLESMNAYSQQSAALLQQPALQKSPATWAVAASRYAEAQTALARWGQAIDADALVKVARKAHAGQPSAGTQSMLMEALELRAALRLAKAQPGFAKAFTQHGRVVDVSTLMVTHIDEDPEFRRAALADADVVEMMALLRDRNQRYPAKASLWAWLLFRHADAPYAETLATRVRQDASYAPHLQLSALFAPRHADTVLSRYHHALATGDRAGAQRVLDEARKAGVALPEVAGRQLKP